MEGDLIMVRVRIWNISSLIMAIIGFIFSLKFQDMAYWRRNEITGVLGKLHMTWFWIGVGLAYAFAITSIILVFLQDKDIKRSTMSNVLRSISSLIVIVTLLWTTFIVIAWFSVF